MRIGTSPITGTIYMGATRKQKNGIELWSGKKTDVTDEAVRAVFDHMYQMAEKTGAYNVSIEGAGYMQFIREDLKEVEEEVKTVLL